MLRFIFLALALALPHANEVAAQDGAVRRTVVGTVLDSTGAVMPKVEVTVTTVDRRVTVHTDTEGRFEVGEAGRGLATIAVIAQGFAPAVMTEVTGERPVVIQLQPARIEEHVEVASVGRAHVTSTATRTAAALIEVPQTIDIVGADILEQQAATSLGDALRNVAGVSPNLGEGRRDQFLIRGFSAQTDTLLDGTRDDAPYYRDVATVDRIEVLKGPAAALFGRGSSGGVINRVLKSPRFDRPIADASMAVGSLGTRRLTADVGRSLNDVLSFRAVAAAEDSTSYRDSYFLQRVTAAPSILWTGASTSALIQAEVLQDRRLPDRGIPSVAGRPADVPRATFYGFAADDFIDTNVASTGLRLEHRTARGWLLRQVVRLGLYDTSFSNTAATGTSRVNGVWQVSRQQYNAEQSQQNLFSQTEVVFERRAAGMQHQVLGGVELGTQRRTTLRFTGFAPPVALVDPQPTRPTYSTTAATYNRFDGTTVGTYVQDQIAFGTHWKALAGIRADRFAQHLDDRRPDNLDLARTDITWSPRAGLVFQPTTHSSLYTSVSRSSQPSGDGLSLALNTAELKPESTRNLEAGAKVEAFGARAIATISVFRLDRSNIKTTDPVDPTRLVLVGQQRTDGVEVALDGRIGRRLRAQGGFAWLDARVLRSNTISSGVRIEGNRPGLVPARSGQVWLQYELTARVAVAGGLTRQGLRYTSNDNLVQLPAYTRADAAVTYSLRRLQLAVNVRNLLGTTFYETASSNFQILPGTPRDVVFTVRVGR
ncbi:MAG: TonB-dependent siderophore receptor [Acidobacteria bacterium]|nr:TonB-dependent siderophore receptor [Acidobacteriota bacterium]